jgi:hypothetical protein
VGIVPKAKAVNEYREKEIRVKEREAVYWDPSRRERERRKGDILDYK